MPLKLYIALKKYSSWSLRPWILLKALSIPFTEITVEIEGGANGAANPALLKISPNGLVPCLEDNGTPVWDSLAICEYLYESHPGVWPAGKEARALARCIASEMHSGFPDVRGCLSMNIMFKLPTPYPVESNPRLAAQLARIEDIWVEARSKFGIPSGEGAYLFGSFTAADAMYAPVVRTELNGLAAIFVARTACLYSSPKKRLTFYHLFTHLPPFFVSHSTGLSLFHLRHQTL